MKTPLRILALLMCAHALAAAEPFHPLLLISMDGFRHDYWQRLPEQESTLRRLQREGVAAAGLIPSFPTNTFPNHYTLVTGLRPGRHGIVNNDFFDPKREQFFHSNQPSCNRDGAWWGGEPIWITAVRQGQKAACAFWVGSEAEINGMRPTYFKAYNYSIPFDNRVEEVVGWLTRPAEERPTSVAFYFEEANGAGHRFGPDSPETDAAIRQLDASLGRLLARLSAAGIEPNVVVVSDHGMTPTSIERVELIDPHLDLAATLVESDGSLVALRPLRGSADELLARAKRIPHGQAYLRDALPAHFHATANPRFAPVWVVAEEGWQLVLKSTFEKHRVRFHERGYLQGDHGYDPTLPSMQGIFLAAGPAFKRGVTLPAVENIHVYALLCAVLHLQPAAHDGDDRLIKAALR